MNKRLHKAILQTLAYSDAFDYPLTVKELWKYLHVNKKVSYKEFLTCIKNQSKGKELLYLPYRQKLASIRKEREGCSLKKMGKARRIAQILSHIPTIRLIGLSGSVAMHNAQKQSDIDLFFITSPYTVWLSRLMVWFVLLLTGEGRRRGDKREADKICPNMFLDERALTLPKKRRNLYTAHEITQLKVLVDKDDLYAFFVFKNSWIRDFLFNAYITKHSYRSSLLSRYSYLISKVEHVARKFQLWYMKKHRTREDVGKFAIAFHPVDYQSLIISTYLRKLQKYGI